MKILIADEAGNIKAFDVDQSSNVTFLKTIIEKEMKIPIASQQLFLNGVLLSNGTSTLKECGVRHDDIILLKGTTQNQGSTLTESERVRLQINRDLATRSRIIQQFPGVEQALNDPVQFERFFTEMTRQAQQQQQQQKDLSSADPFDVESQRKIEETIRKQNILQSRENALEHHPGTLDSLNLESFGRVVMLYIGLEVNGHKVKAFVDSGAQMTIMSPDCAMACGLMHQLDDAFAGTAG